MPVFTHLAVVNVSLRLAQYQNVPPEIPSVLGWPTLPLTLIAADPRVVGLDVAQLKEDIPSLTAEARRAIESRNSLLQCYSTYSEFWNTWMVFPEATKLNVVFCG